MTMEDIGQGTYWLGSPIDKEDKVVKSNKLKPYYPREHGYIERMQEALTPKDISDIGLRHIALHNWSDQSPTCENGVDIVQPKAKVQTSYWSHIPKVEDGFHQLWVSQGPVKAKVPMETCSYCTNNHEPTFSNLQVPKAKEGPSY